MRHGHRSAHLKAVLASAVVAGGVIAYGWGTRAARPVPSPFPGEAPAPSATIWDVAVETPAGTARVELLSDAAGGQVMRISLPPGLDAAEPGLVVEADGGPPRVLGSVSAGRTHLPVPDGLPAGGRLLLLDLARDIRLGEAAIPEGNP